MKIMTCNIRASGALDPGKDNWSFRKQICADVLREQAPDIVCFQEMWDEQFVDLSVMLPEFNSYGIADTALSLHPVNTIFYRAADFTKISAGGYWLSQTPHIAGSRSWDSECVRLANWIRLRDRRTGIDFKVINTHLDHIGQVARESQAHLILEDCAAYPNDYPQILTGDMNCDHRNAAIHVFKSGGWSDTYGAVHGTENPGFTFHQFLGPKYKSESGMGKMDWIFVKGKIKARDAEIIKSSTGNRFPSDHYFVSATVDFH